MLYLATQFVWFLLAAFAMGFVMGWLASDGGKLDLWSGKYLYAAGLWLLGGALAWLQTVNGVPALWLETALLFVATYFAGCALASVVRASLSPQSLIEAATGVDLAGLSETAKDGIEKAGEVKSTLESAREMLDDARSTAGRLGIGAKPASEQPLPGEKPAGLASARNSKADDLKLISGVGPQNEGRLHGLGIWHFDQVAAWTPANVEWVGGYLSFPGRIEREDWVGQAKLLASGAETAFAQRARAGEVASSRDDGSQGQSNVVLLGGARDKAKGGKPKS